MSRYDDIKGTNRFRKLTPWNETEVAGLRAAQPGVPGDYIDFLCEVGACEIGDSSFMLYGSLLLQSDVYDSATAAVLADIVLLGAVVESDPVSHEADVIDGSFESFVRRRLMQYGEWLPNG